MLRSISLVTIIIGLAALAPSTRAQDGEQPPPPSGGTGEEDLKAPTYCCTVQIPWGLDQQCCGPNGCRVSGQGCSSW